MKEISQFNSNLSTHNEFRLFGRLATHTNDSISRACISLSPFLLRRARWKRGGRGFEVNVQQHWELFKWDFSEKGHPTVELKYTTFFYEFLTLNPFRSRASPLLTPKGIFIEVMSKVLQLEFAFVYHLFHIVLYSSSSRFCVRLR